ncbi:hypothetical protein HON36_00655 [Candidatus Parcubacteria bacterium]|nr:hypothetical protein [Candidatus Parcubacteria bacterium]
MLNNKTITYFLLVGVFISFMFGCALSAGDFFTKNMSGMNHAECCDDDQLTVLGSNKHNITSALIQNNLVEFLIVLAAVFIFSKLSINDFYSTRAKNYCRSIKDRYGGFKTFYYFIDLFSSGTLHPKLF